MAIEKNNLNKNAMGGTELMGHALYKNVEPGLLEHFQIIQSRFREIQPGKIPIYWLHDLPGDPESEHLKSGGWNKFEKLVFVSNWQQFAYNTHFGIPPSKSVVIQNAIEPIDVDYNRDKPKDKIKIIYHTTPHRGLNILYAAFEELSNEFKNIELDVYSSFSLYGWPDRDKPYEELFARLKEHPQINYHGAVSNEEVREALKSAHIFAYPSIWQETSCISLMEAMSAGCVCIHPNYGALWETAANLTLMYNWQEDQRDHLNLFYGILKQILLTYNFNEPESASRMLYTKHYADMFYSWKGRKMQWEGFLKDILKRKKILK